MLRQLEADLEMLSAELVARQDELVAFYAVTQALRSCLEIRPTFSTIVAQLQKLIPCVSTFAILADPERIVVSPEGDIDFALIHQWLSELQTAENDFQRKIGDGQHLTITPLFVSDEIQGALGLLRESPFTSPERKLINDIAANTAPHIENILLHKESLAQARMQSEMDVARRVQLQLLPHQVPAILGLDIAAYTQPALEVGGDFYDYLMLPDSSGLMLAVGDVSGKGMSAAMLMAMVRNTLRNALHFVPEAEPDVWMQHANTALYDDFTETHMLATAFFGRLDLGTRTLSYANAGHSPVIFCPQGSEPYMLEADGTALGILPDSLCENQTLPLNSGDVLVIGTDGLVEARRDDGDDMFGYEQLMDLIASVSHESAETIARTLLDSVKAYAGNRAQDDDQTLVVVKGIGYDN